MVHLYYYDGKLRNAPTKMQSESEIVEQLNKWTKKIDAANGYTNCMNRFTKLYNESDPDRDYHVVTNSHDIYSYALNVYNIIVFVYVPDSDSWRLHKGFDWSAV